MQVDTSRDAVERLAQDVMAPDYLAPTKATVANTLRALLAHAEAAEAEVAAAVQAEREAICALLSTHVYSTGTDGPYLRPERQAAIDIHHQTIISAIRAAAGEAGE